MKCLKIQILCRKTSISRGKLRRHAAPQRGQEVVFARDSRYSRASRTLRIHTGFSVLNLLHWKLHPGKRTVRFTQDTRSYVVLRHVQYQRHYVDGWSAAWLNIRSVSSKSHLLFLDEQNQGQFLKIHAMVFWTNFFVNTNQRSPFRC